MGTAVTRTRDSPLLAQSFALSRALLAAAGIALFSMHVGAAPAPVPAPTPTPQPAVSTPPSPPLKKDNLLRISFIDVGQGDAIWIQGPSRHGKPARHFVIDGGPESSAAEGQLVDYLEQYGLKKGSIIDSVVATHPHDDHYYGLIEILEDYEVRQIIDTGFPYPEKNDKGKQTSYGRFMQLAREEKAAGKAAELISVHAFAPKELKLDWSNEGTLADETDITVEVKSGFWKGQDPDAYGLRTEGRAINSASTILRLTYGKVSFLFTGDEEAKTRKGEATKPPNFAEKLLLDSWPGGLQSTLLKVPHHGSETSSTVKFIQEVRPQVVVVMSGRRKYGTVILPDDTTLARYKAQMPDVKLVRTDRHDANESRTRATDADGDHVYAYTDGDQLTVFEARKLSGKWRWVKAATVTPPDQQ